MVVVVVVVVVCAKLVPNTMALKVILVFELFLVFPRTNAVGGLAENKGSLLAFFAHRNLFALKRMLLAMFFYASSAKALFGSVSRLFPQAFCLGDVAKSASTALLIAVKPQKYLEIFPVFPLANFVTSIFLSTFTTSALVQAMDPGTSEPWLGHGPIPTKAGQRTGCWRCGVICFYR